MTTHTRIQTLALGALQTVAREHIGSDFDRDDTLHAEITKGCRRQDNQTVFHINLSGKCELGAEVTVHDEASEAHRISILVLSYRRMHQETYHCPNSLFHTTVAK
ncbi:MAG: hypothetical protein NTX72_04495 [Candidatus Uhrbacteria bacterium]|nr:hypothetical protein [Candidatus Uhrbacteria bacterium]